MRLFFAIWPDAPARAALAALAADVAQVCDGRAEPAERIHLTLAFLGEVADERVGAAVAAASAVAIPPIVLKLDCVGSFRRARVAWAGSLEADAALAALRSDLAARLARAGFALEDRPFAAHVTLARRIARALPRATIPPIEWRARGFALVRTERGSGDYTDVEVFGD